MPKTLYFDESGWTGFDLLNADQPIFAIASTDIGDEVAAEILADAFPLYRGGEYKFSTLWRSPRNRQGFIRLAEHLANFEGHVFAWVTFKRFAVLTKIVDFIIEPMITARGWDFYTDGFCWKYANLIHSDMTARSTPQGYDRMLRTYQAFTRRPAREGLMAFRDAILALPTDGSQTMASLKEVLVAGTDAFEQFHDIEHFAASDELHVSSMLASTTWWRRRFADDFEIVHDQSANFFRRQDEWLRIANDHQPPEIEIGGDGEAVEFPLRVTDTRQINSIDSRAVQLSDAVAGLVSRRFDPRLTAADQGFMGELIEAGLGRLNWNGTRPGNTFPRPGLPLRLDGPDAVDRLAMRMYPRREGSAPTSSS